MSNPTLPDQSPAKHPGGRPLKFQSVEDIPFCIEDFKFLGFNNESNMSDYLESNIRAFSEVGLGERYKSHTREASIRHRSFGANEPRIDFIITTQDNRRIFIEVKNPTQVYSEMTRSVSQLMAYATIADDHIPADRLVIVTSNTCSTVQKMIQKYELPITVVLMTKDLLAVWSREWEDQLN